jgi:hypothetical protein
VSVHLVISTDMLLCFAAVVTALTYYLFKSFEVTEFKSPLCLDVSTLHNLNEIKSSCGIMDVCVWIADNIMND